MDGKTIPLQPIPGNNLPKATIEDTILRSGVTRRFARKPVPLPALSTILHVSTGGLPGDYLPGPEDSFAEPYMIINAVDSCQEGVYDFHTPSSSLVLLKEGSFRRDAGYCCLEQELAADASVVVFFMTDLERVLARSGNRGYRIAHLEAGTVGGKLYLSSHALGLGATGLTFYDDDATTFFSPRARERAGSWSL